MQDVARTRFRDARNQRTDAGHNGFQQTDHEQDHRLSGLRAATTRHAGRRTLAIILSRLLETRAGLSNDQSVSAGGAEGQQRNDDGEHAPAHRSILAFWLYPTLVVGPQRRSASQMTVQETGLHRLSTPEAHRNRYEFRPNTQQVALAVFAQERRGRRSQRRRGLAPPCRCAGVHARFDR